MSNFARRYESLLFWFSPASKKCLHGRWASFSTRKFKYYQHKDNPISLTVASWHHHLLFGWQARIYTRCGSRKRDMKRIFIHDWIENFVLWFSFFIFQMVLCVSFTARCRYWLFSMLRVYFVTEETYLQQQHQHWVSIEFRGWICQRHRHGAAESKTRNSGKIYINFWISETDEELDNIPARKYTLTHAARDVMKTLISKFITRRETSGARISPIPFSALHHKTHKHVVIRRPPSPLPPHTHSRVHICFADPIPP